MYTQWLPYKWYYQIFYVIYRWVVGLYFNSWLIAAGAHQDHPKFFIFLTNWSFIVLNVYLLYAALSTTVDYFKVFICYRQYDNLNLEHDADEFDIVEPKGCFSHQYNQIKWYHMIQWVLFTIGTEAAVAVVILFWSLLYKGIGSYDVYDGHFHLGNGLVGVLDLWVSGLPIRLLHFYILQIYAAAYVSFTGVYYAAGGTGGTGRPGENATSYIYPPLDYAGHPGSAAGLCIATVLILPIIIHSFFYLQYVVRYWLVYVIYGRQQSHALRVDVPLLDNEL